MLPFFVKGWKWKYFFYIPSNPLPIVVRNSLTNKFFQKNWQFSIFSKQTKKCKTEVKRRVIPAFEIVQTLFNTIFCQILKMIFFLISLAFPCPLRSGIHWQTNFSQKIDVSVFKKKKKMTSLYRDIHPGDSWPYVPWL